jgi:hypothetical protein
MSTSPFSRAPLAILVDNVDLRGAIFEAKPEVCASYTKRKALNAGVRSAASSANGYGTKTSPAGAVFAGHMMNGQLSGLGEWRSARGSVIRGMFRNDLAEGYAEAEYSDGRTYKGEYHLGRLHGRGRVCYPDGYTYEGNFKYGQKHGSGVETFPGGGRYSCVMRHNRVTEAERLD